MNDWTRETRTAEAAMADATVGSDYRIREVEARLDRRVAALEAQRLRSGLASRLMRAGFVATLAAVALALWTLLPDDGAWVVDSISAEEIVLRDADGIARALLVTDADGRARLSLTDRDGRERIRLTVLADGSPGVTISDPDSRPRAVLGYLPDGTTNLVFADAQGVSRAVLGVEADGSTHALFADRSGAIRAVIGVGAEGAPSVSTFAAGTETEGP